jgi:drug/metabolite transporter (DMT)-like permease
LWAFIPVVSRYGQISLDHYQFLFWSSLLSLVVVFVSCAFAQKLKELSSYSSGKVFAALFLGFLGAFLYYLLLYYGYAHLRALEVVVLQYTWPIFVVILSVLILGEQITARTLIAVTLGFLGVLCVFSKGQFAQLHFENYKMDGIVLLGAAAFGLFSTLSKKWKFESFTLGTYLFLSATVCSFVAMQCFSHFAIPAHSSWLPIFVNGALINGLSYVLWLQALKHAQASFIAPFVFLTPVIAAFLVVLIFHEPLLPAYSLGLVAVIAAALVSR